MIAIALACGPRLLFADEPTTALDVTVQAQILDLLQAQQRERFMAMVLVTHDLGVVAGRTDDIAVMYAGRIVEKAPTRVLFADDSPSVHRGVAEVDPEARRSRATPGSTRSPAARPTCQAADRLQVRGALPVRAGRSASPRNRRSSTPTTPGHFVPLLLTRSEPRRAPHALERNLAAGENATGHARAARSATRSRRGAVALMAGSGTAHLRPEGETLLRVEDLVVEFPVGRTGLKVHAVTERQPRREGRRDARARRRVGLRQVDDRQGDHAVAAADIGHGAVRRPRHDDS